MHEQLQTGEKILLLVRHAKSSWDAGVASDFERPLNERGIKDAPVMAARLKNKKIFPDAFVSSPAKRALETAISFCNGYGVASDEIILIPSLYHADIVSFFKVVSALDDKLNTVAIFSHNPGITAFVNMLTEKVHIDNMPTCGIFCVKVKTVNWIDFKDSPREFLLFDYPKNV